MKKKLILVYDIPILDKYKYSKELKLEIVRRYLKGESSLTLAHEYRIIYCLNEDAPIHGWRKKETNKRVGKQRGKYKV